MTAAPASLDVAWCSPDGRRVPIDPTGLAIEVAAGVRIDVAIQSRGAARLAVALTLVGRRRLHAQAAEASARLVVIPLGDAAFVVAVAEPSEDPVVLVPVPASPAWTQGGAAMPARDGWLAARRPEGAGIELRIVPGPDDMSLCALRVSAMPPSGGRFTNHREAGGSVRLSVPRLSPQLLALECEWVFHGAGHASQSWP